MKRWIFRILALAMFLPALCGCAEKEEEPRLDLCSELQSVDRLELGRMTVGKVGMITDPSYSQAKSLEKKATALFNKMKIGTRIGVYSYDTYLVAYIDLSRLRPEDVATDEESKVVRIKLPPVEIMTDGRDVTLKEEHCRVTGLRSLITPSERARLKRQMAAEVKKEIARDEAGKRMLRTTAEAKAKVWVRELLGNMGYETEFID